jgi:hypothetical protein
MEDFKLDWERKDSFQDKPATDEEITQEMGTIRETLEILKKNPEFNNIFFLSKIRTPVAKAVAARINLAGSASAAVDVGQDPIFNEERECYESSLTVAKDDSIMNVYTENLLSFHN